MVEHRVNIPFKGDFLIDDTYLFEIGGKNKSASQITGIPKSYVVKDNLEYPVGNALALWVSGFFLLIQVISSEILITGGSYQVR